ncbi:aminoglycoside phosphotransferase family protein [Microbacterium rhizomatis]
MPAAEVVIDERLVRDLLTDQAPHLLTTGPRVWRVAAGWDSEVWRVGDDVAVRMPRRAVAAPLVRHEQEVLPSIAVRIAAAGLDVAIPTPMVHGRPAAGYPWPWSVVPWFTGDVGLVVPPSDRGPWAVPLARTLIALHSPAEEDYPPNPFRGVPLADRDVAVESRIASLRVLGVESSLVDAAARCWRRAMQAPTWAGPPVWIHGDLHPGNLVSRGGELVAVIDFGDVTAGDPAYDLAIAWLAFDPASRRTFTEAAGARYDAATWTRAAGWAAAMAVLLVEQSDDNPLYARCGLAALHELAGDRTDRTEDGEVAQR